MAVSKVFDTQDFDAIRPWIDMFDAVAAEGRAGHALVTRCEMRDWEYGWLLHTTKPKAGMRVIDIGCDKTLFPVVLKRMGCEVFAVDMNFDEQTENWFYREGVVVLRGDGTKVPYPTGFFDRVYSICVGEHVGDTTCRGWPWHDWKDKLTFSTTMFLKECLRLLRNGGLMGHTFDFYFPQLESVVRGFNPELTTALMRGTPGAVPQGDYDFGLTSKERNVPRDYWEPKGHEHTAVACVWRRDVLKT